MAPFPLCLTKRGSLLGGDEQRPQSLEAVRASAQGVAVRARTGAEQVCVCARAARDAVCSYASAAAQGATGGADDAEEEEACEARALGR